LTHLNFQYTPKID